MSEILIYPSHLHIQKYFLTQIQENVSLGEISFVQGDSKLYDST
jgi:hypothetical protein